MILFLVTRGLTLVLLRGQVSEGRLLENMPQLSCEVLCNPKADTCLAKYRGLWIELTATFRALPRILPKVAAVEAQDARQSLPY